MNQRIQELIEQAEKYAEEKSTWRGDNTEWRNEFEGIFKEKFAELIVQECADFISRWERFQVEQEFHHGGIRGGGGKELKRHFGVE